MEQGGKNNEALHEELKMYFQNSVLFSCVLFLLDANMPDMNLNVF